MVAAQQSYSESFGPFFVLLLKLQNYCNIIAGKVI